MIDPFAWLAGWIQENVLVPVLWQCGSMEWEDQSFMWALFAVYGVLQVAINVAVCWPLERFRPIQVGSDPAGEPEPVATGLVRTDIIYTLIGRIGVFPLVTFFGFYTAQTWLNGVLTDAGYVPPTLERFFPFLLSMPVATFVFYAVLLDFADYWRHRFSHSVGWWYGLHSVHHAQTRMTFWSDDRNHVLDDVIAYLWFIAAGLLIGVPPMQFPVLVLVLRLVESLSHANTRISFGWLGERLLVSPSFHRAHHGLEAGGTRSFNFGAMFPWWDMMFGTADWRRGVVETGDRNASRAVSHGSWWQQQTGGFARAVHLATWRRRARRRAFAAAQAVSAGSRSEASSPSK